MTSYYFQIVSLLCIFCCAWATESANKKLPSAVIIGTVYCDTCFHTKITKSSYLISGASLAVDCHDNATKFSFRKEVNTKNGAFTVQLPQEISKEMKLIKACKVKLLKSSEPFCPVASSATSTALHLKSKANNGVHVFSAGLLTFRPLQQPQQCYRKPILGDRKAVIEHPTSLFFPEPNIPYVPSPPNIGGVPLPPNPLQPPPSLLPPNPLQPPPAPLIGLPPLPVLTPPPPPPFFKFPPLLPLPPNPLYPGIPPAFNAKEKVEP